MYLLLQLATDWDLTFNLAVFHPRKKEILDRTHECFQVNQNCGVILIWHFLPESLPALHVNLIAVKHKAHLHEDFLTPRPVTGLWVWLHFEVSIDLLKVSFESFVQHGFRIIVNWLNFRRVKLRKRLLLDLLLFFWLSALRIIKQSFGDLGCWLPGRLFLINFWFEIIFRNFDRFPYKTLLLILVLLAESFLLKNLFTVHIHQTWLLLYLLLLVVNYFHKLLVSTLLKQQLVLNELLSRALRDLVI